jgi:hypothetical protein
MAEWADLRGIPFEVWRLRNIDQQIAEHRRKLAEAAVRRLPAKEAATVDTKKQAVPRQARAF